MQKISLILPTLNNSKNLNNFLYSVSTDEEINSMVEIIIIDQSESNRTKTICTKFNKKFTNSIIYRKSRHLGLSVNRNKGLQIATGDIIAFPDDDCIYYPDTFINGKIIFLIMKCFQRLNISKF